jgi:hypothetical protein
MPEKCAFTGYDALDAELPGGGWPWSGKASGMCSAAKSNREATQISSTSTSTRFCSGAGTAAFASESYKLKATRRTVSEKIEEFDVSGRQGNSTAARSFTPPCCPLSLNCRKMWGRFFRSRSMSSMRGGPTRSGYILQIAINVSQCSKAFCENGHGVIVRFRPHSGCSDNPLLGNNIIDNRSGATLQRQVRGVYHQFGNERRLVNGRHPGELQ